MAKRSTVHYTPEQTKAAEQIGQQLAEGLADEFFTLEGTPKLPVKYAAGNYDTKPLYAGLEYTFNGLFVGARGYPVFQFSPEDAQEYDLVDFTLQQLDDYLPLFGPKMAEVLGYTDIDAAPAVMARAVAEHFDKAKKAEEKAKQEEKAAAAALPGFGRFG